MKHEQHHGPLEPQDVEELLPWYVTGRVSREEARGIEAALKTMPDLAGKLTPAKALDLLAGALGPGRPATEAPADQAPRSASSDQLDADPRPTQLDPVTDQRQGWTV